MAKNARALTDADFMLPGGTVFSYSNFGYSLAGAVLESISKRPYADVLGSSVLTPLGMSQSTDRAADAMTRPHATGYRLDGQALVATPHANDTRIWPAGYLWTNATDSVARAVRAHVEGPYEGSRRSLANGRGERQPLAHAMPNIFVGGHYGHGLMIAHDRDMLFYEHGGTLPGFSSILRIAPERRLGLAILANLDNAPLRRVAQAVMAKALALPDLTTAARQESPVTPDEMKLAAGPLPQSRERGTVRARRKGDALTRRQRTVCRQPNRRAPLPRAPQARRRGSGVRAAAGDAGRSCGTCTSLSGHM